MVKLVSSLTEQMRDTSSLWIPPIYRRLVSFDKRDRDMSERCLLKIMSLIFPPPFTLSEVTYDINSLLLSINLISFFFFFFMFQIQSHTYSSS